MDMLDKPNNENMIVQEFAGIQMLGLAVGTR